jgi:hypothetical protein
MKRVVCWKLKGFACIPRLKRGLNVRSVGARGTLDARVDIVEDSKRPDSLSKSSGLHAVTDLATVMLIRRRNVIAIEYMYA